MKKYEVSFRDIYNSNNFDFKTLNSLDAANEVAKKLREDGMKEVEVQEVDDISQSEAQEIIRKRFTA